MAALSAAGCRRRASKFPVFHLLRTQAPQGVQLLHPSSCLHFSWDAHPRQGHEVSLAPTLESIHHRSPKLQNGAGAGGQVAPSPLIGADAQYRAPPSLRAMENPTCSYFFFIIFFFSNNLACGFQGDSVQALSSPASRAELMSDSVFSQSALINIDGNGFQWLWILPVHT